MNFGVELKVQKSITHKVIRFPLPLRIAPVVPDGYIVTRAWD